MFHAPDCPEAPSQAYQAPGQNAKQLSDEARIPGEKVLKSYYGARYFIPARHFWTTEVLNSYIPLLPVIVFSRSPAPLPDGFESGCKRLLHPSDYNDPNRSRQSNH